MIRPSVPLGTERSGFSPASGGEKSVKKRMIDRKIPAARRDQIPVLTDGTHILAVFGLGTDVRRAARPGDRAVMIKIWSRGEKQP